MLFMLRISIEILPLAALLPVLWGALGVLIIASVLAYRRRTTSIGVPRDGRGAKWLSELLSLAFVPLAILAWGLLLWPQDGRSHHERVGLIGIDVFGAVELVLAVWLVWRHRRRLWQTVPVAVIALWWCAGAIFTASMAVTDSWL